MKGVSSDKVQVLMKEKSKCLMSCIMCRNFSSLNGRKSGTKPESSPRGPGGECKRLQEEVVKKCHLAKKTAETAMEGRRPPMIDDAHRECLNRSRDVEAGCKTFKDVERNIHEYCSNNETNGPMKSSVDWMGV